MIPCAECRVAIYCSLDASKPSVAVAVGAAGWDVATVPHGPDDDSTICGNAAVPRPAALRGDGETLHGLLFPRAEPGSDGLVSLDSGTNLEGNSFSSAWLGIDGRTGNRARKSTGSINQLEETHLSQP